MAPARFLVLGDGEAGVALASLLPGAFLAPSAPPRPDLSARGVAVPAGPRYLHAGAGASALLRAAGLREPGAREVRFAFTAEGRTVPPEEAPEAWRHLYWRKSRPGEPGPSLASAASAGAEKLLASGAPYWELLTLLREKLRADGRLLPYAAPPRDPDPDVPWTHPELLRRCGTAEQAAPRPVLYTCPPSAIWPAFRERALDKVFHMVRPFREALTHWPGQPFEYAYRPGAEVPWHRETLVWGRAAGSASDAGPAVVLEWTLPSGHAWTPEETRLQVRPHGAEDLGAPAILRGAQVLPSAEFAPRGAAWRPVGRLAERRHGLLVTDVAEAALGLLSGR